MTDEERRVYEEYVFSDDYFEEFRKLVDVSDIMTPKEFKRARQLISLGLVEKYAYRYKISAKNNRRTPFWRRWKEKHDEKVAFKNSLKQLPKEDVEEIKERLNSVETVVKQNLLSQPHQSSVTPEDLLGPCKSSVLIENSNNSKSVSESEAAAD